MELMVALDLKFILMTKKKYWLLTVLILLVSLFLRVYQINQVPPAIYWEEAALGYDAYSLFKTGQDHHGNSWPILAVESFGDWKPAGYFYAAIPFIGVLGLNETAVRLPSALSGVLIVLGIGVLVKQVITLELSQ